ncbi:carboxymuconolactone decarboxylase family protein [Deinococcus arenicola]|uniref:Carboxymuconolactone decarboxylase family protein n=1 Tax=Deinococcus arenicola TaxID=2994950 RepID=A0ABU4DSJ7_9DEIO|nr:carboxymuconolactone decarboxylase family protein [Deinococcus sp. ZS9-10]MDV6374855.1 carboxymuconolactone decarboxylase family protein [Deinococcus sp. ZS9-10]
MSDSKKDAPPPAEKGHARTVIFGSQHDRIVERLEGLDPDLASHIQGFAYDTVYDNSALDLKTQELIACALLVSLGSPPELRTHLRGAMNAGATEEEVRGALMLCVPYLGFPRAVAGFEALRTYLQDQDKKKG